MAGRPNHAVGGRLAARTRAHHVAYIGYEMAFFLQIIDELHRPALTVFLGAEGRICARVFEHRQVVHGNVRAAPGVGRGRQVVGIGLAGHFEHGHGNAARHLGAHGEPLGVGPALHHLFGHGIASLRFDGHIMEKVEHEQGLFQGLCRQRCHLGVVEQIDQGFDVVATHHGAQ